MVGQGRRHWKGIIGGIAFFPSVLWEVMFNPSMLYRRIVHRKRWASMHFSQQHWLARPTGTDALWLCDAGGHRRERVTKNAQRLRGTGRQPCTGVHLARYK